MHGKRNIFACACIYVYVWHTHFHTHAHTHTCIPCLVHGYYAHTHPHKRASSPALFCRRLERNMCTFTHTHTRTCTHTHKYVYTIPMFTYTVLHKFVNSPALSVSGEKMLKTRRTDQEHPSGRQLKMLRRLSIRCVCVCAYVCVSVNFACLCAYVCVSVNFACFCA